MKFFLIFLVIFILFGGLNYFISKQIMIWFKALLPSVKSLFVGIAYWIFIFFMILGMIISMSNLPLPLYLTRFFARLSDYFMGIFLYILVFVLLAKVVVIALKFLKLLPTPVPNNSVVIIGGIVVLLIVSFVTYGFFNARNLKLVKYDIKIEKTMTIDNLKVVLISDLHLGSTNGIDHLARIVNKINEQKADIVLLAGDIFNNNYNMLAKPDDAVQLFNAIKTKYGVYGVVGNHDAGKTYTEMMMFLERSHIKILEDEYLIVADSFVLIGRKDSSPIGEQGEKRQSIDSMLSILDKEMPIIVIDHQPSNVKEYNNDVDLILSGHTHKGQLFPNTISARLTYDFLYGHYPKEGNRPQVIVTSGVGTWGPPLRVGTNSEVVVINISFKES